MKETMADPASSSAGFVLGIKSGALAAGFATAVSVLAVAVGLTVVPLKKGDEKNDLLKRLVCGLFSSFTLGPVMALKAINMMPWLLEPWLKVFAGHPLLSYLAAAGPFLAIAALPGFWLVAGLMRWFTNRAGKDIQEMAQDAMPKP
jgi:hypothetical protein